MAQAETDAVASPGTDGSDGTAGPWPGAAELMGALRRRSVEVGIASIGVAPASPMARTRKVLEERRAAGLAAGMQFTYRNPARSTSPGRVLAGARALVVAAWPYAGESSRQGDPRAPGAPGEHGDPAGPGSAAGGRGGPRGRVARYAQRDHYGAFRSALGELARLLGDHGWAARVVVDDNALVDRAAAVNAGIGWYGKNCNVLLPQRGSWFLLGSVVTDAPLPFDGPQEEGCGTCRRCLSACPTGALVAPGVLDARRCLAWLVQAPGMFPFDYRAALGARIYGCDDCQEVCPVNRAAIGAEARGTNNGAAAAAEAPSGPAGPPEGSCDAGGDVDVLGILCASGPDLLAAFGRWYIPRRDPRYLQRNALVVLGNVADGRSPAIAEVLRRYLSGADEMLRAHAVWAAARLGRHDLLDVTPGLGEDPSPLVREEVRRRHEVVPASAERSSAHSQPRP